MNIKKLIDPQAPRSTFPITYTMEPKKTYLGDSVYAHHDGFHVVLTVENGMGPSETIALDPEVLHALAVYTASLNNPTS